MKKTGNRIAHNNSAFGFDLDNVLPGMLPPLHDEGVSRIDHIGKTGPELFQWVRIALEEAFHNGPGGKAVGQSPYQFFPM